MKTVIDTGFIDENGKLQITHQARFVKAIAAFPNTPVEIVVSPVRNGITHKQRRYFFGVIVDLLHSFFEGTGVRCTKQDVLDLLKDRFLYREHLCPITSKYLKVPISLSNSEKAMTKEEFQKAKEAIQQWGAETLGGLDIPDPDPQWRMYKENKK